MPGQAILSEVVTVEPPAHQQEALPTIFRAVDQGPIANTGILTIGWYDPPHVRLLQNSKAFRIFVGDRSRLAACAIRLRLTRTALL